MFLDRGFLAIGNVSGLLALNFYQFAFVMGLALFIGPKNTVGFFMKKTRREGSAAFFVGFFLIIIGWFMLTTIGFLSQMYGLWKIFGSFIPAVFSYV